MTTTSNSVSAIASEFSTCVPDAVQREREARTVRR
jgi:hypothetical protein